jgi:hypothetical protein
MKFLMKSVLHETANLVLFYEDKHRIFYQQKLSGPNHLLPNVLRELFFSPFSVSRFEVLFCFFEARVLNVLNAHAGNPLFDAMFVGELCGLPQTKVFQDLLFDLPMAGADEIRLKASLSGRT